MMCSKRDSNSHGHFCPKDFKSFVSTIPPFERPRAENETRTRDPNLGKVVLYQLSYFRVLFFCFAPFYCFEQPLLAFLRVQRYELF